MELEKRGGGSTRTPCWMFTNNAATYFTYLTDVGTLPDENEDDDREKYAIRPDYEKTLAKREIHSPRSWSY